MENKYLCSICGVDIFSKLIVNKVFHCGCGNEFCLTKIPKGFLVNNITTGDLKFLEGVKK